MKTNMFPTLGQSVVRVGIAADRYIEVKRLGIEDYDRYMELRRNTALEQERLSGAPIAAQIDAQNRIRAELLSLVTKYLPAALHDDAKRMNEKQLIELLTVLANGDDDPIPDDPQKKMIF